MKIKRAITLPLRPFPQLQQFPCIAIAFVLFIFRCVLQFRQCAHCLCVRSLSCKETQEIERSNTQPMHLIPQLQRGVCIFFAFVLFMCMCFLQLRERAHCLCIRSLRCKENYENRESEHTASASVPSVAVMFMYIRCMCSL